MLRIISYELWVYNYHKLEIKVDCYYFQIKTSFRDVFNHWKNNCELHYEISCRTIKILCWHFKIIDLVQYNYKHAELFLGSFQKLFVTIWYFFNHVKSFFIYEID